jgi:hypothetical protein
MKKKNQFKGSILRKNNEYVSTNLLTCVCKIRKYLKKCEEIIVRELTRLRERAGEGKKSLAREEEGGGLLDMSTTHIDEEECLCFLRSLCHLRFCCCLRYIHNITMTMERVATKCYVYRQ